MKRFLLLTFLICTPLAALAQPQPRSYTASWEDPNNPPGSIIRYTIYAGSVSGGPYNQGKYEVPGGTLSLTMTLAKGTWYFVVTATNATGESDYSNEASITVQDNARKPINFKIVINP